MRLLRSKVVPNTLVARGTLFLGAENDRSKCLLRAERVPRRYVAAVINRPDSIVRVRRRRHMVSERRLRFSWLAVSRGIQDLNLRQRTPKEAHYSVRHHFSEQAMYSVLTVNCGLSRARDAFSYGDFNTAASTPTATTKSEPSLMTMDCPRVCMSLRRSAPRAYMSLRRSATSWRTSVISWRTSVIS